MTAWQNVALGYIFKAKHTFEFLESITFTTHGEYIYLDNLIPLLRRWKGPLSMAVFAPGEGKKNGRICIDILSRYFPRGWQGRP